MILPIYGYGHSILIESGEEVGKKYPGLKNLIRDMFETCNKADGIGLAAQQVGHGIQLFVINLSNYGGDEPEYKDYKKAFMNSIILGESEDLERMEEGCLSFPGVHADVVRPNWIKVEYMNEKFETITETLTGLLARVFLHEHEHTEGINFIDHANSLRKKLMKKELKIINDGGLFDNYKMKFAGK